MSPLHPSVREAFVRFSTPLEGCKSWMYLDVKGWVTTAIGCLIDPVELALPLPWQRRRGKPASRDEIANEWARIKNTKWLASRGAAAAEELCELHLTDDAIDELVEQRLEAIVSALVRRFAEFPTWPADAQLGTLSLAWACGSNFAYPELARALERRDFAAAIRECDIRGNLHRSVAQVALFALADLSEREGLDPGELLYRVP